MYFWQAILGQKNIRKLPVKAGLLLFTLVFLFIVKAEPVEAANFIDMKGHWAEKTVERLSDQGIINGSDGGRFFPDKQVTRAELVSMVVRALTQEEDRANTLDVEVIGLVSLSQMGPNLQAVTEPYYRDVPTGRWYFPYIQAAAQRKLIAVNQHKQFNPEQPVSRQETAVMLARALDPRLDNLINKQELLTFKDQHSVADWAWRGIYLVTSKGIMKGDKNGQFRPEAGTTKAELAVMLSNWVNNYRAVHIPILTYHHLVPEATIESGNPAIITQMAFTAQMQLLKDLGYHTITSQDLFDYLRKGLALPDKPVLITFDDGYESNYTLAFPILKKFGMKAMINIIVGFTPGEEGGSALRDNATAAVPFLKQNHLTWEQMREMVLSGLIEIQSHTYDSHRLVPTEDGKMRPELTTEKLSGIDGRKEPWEEYNQRVYKDFYRAKERIEERLGTKVTVLAYPYGAFNETTEKLAKEVGYLMTLTTRKGFVKSGDSEYRLKRITINGDDDLAAFQQKLLVGQNIKHPTL